MNNIKIFVTHTPNKMTAKVDNPLFYNVIAGSDFQTEKVPEGFYLDNQGDNISSCNKSYCELTTQYWAWKNQEADYYGFCHYRRFFNFNSDAFHESRWGTVEYDYLNEKVIKELGFDEKNIRACVEQYDFLIAKGIDASCMNAKTIYQQYENAKDLHIKDIELLLEIIEEKYPKLSTTAKRFFEGKIFYPCNMFIMKKAIFQDYSRILFDILNEFEQRADMRNYSREGYRTTGHLGERIASIYYLYLKENTTFNLGELQVALIHHMDAEEVVKITKNAIPIVLSANQKYVPILATCLQSIIDCASANNKYHIYIFHTDILIETQDKFTKDLSDNNITISFVNVSQHAAGYSLQAKQHITTETFYRFFIIDILKAYDKVLYLDADMIICRDVADLYHTDLGDTLIAGTIDADFAGQCNMKKSEMLEYCKNVLGLENPFAYFQAGVLLFNVKALQKVTSVEKLLQMADTGIYRFSDQDILNIVCKEKVTYLDMSWNLLTDCNHYRWSNVIKHAPYYILDAYEKARKKPNIIHYAGYLKPWLKPDEDFANVFWNIARKTDYYEILLSNMTESKMQSYGSSTNATKRLSFLEMLRGIMKHFFPKDSKARMWAIKVYFKLKNIN